MDKDNSKFPRRHQSRNPRFLFHHRSRPYTQLCVLPSRTFLTRVNLNLNRLILPGYTGSQKMVPNPKTSTSFKVTGTLEAIISSSDISFRSWDDCLIMTTWKEGQVSFRDVKTGEVLKNFSILNAEDDRSINTCFSSKKQIFCSLSNNLLESRDIETGELIRSWKVGNSPVRCMDHNDFASLLALGCADHSIKIWNSSQGFCTHNLKGIHGGVITDVKFHPNPQCMELFSASDDGSIVRWNLIEGKAMKTYKSHVSSVRALAVSEDGKYLVSGGRDQVINIWTIEGKLVKTIPTLESIESIIFIKPDVFISAGENGIIRVWNLLSGSCIKSSQKLTIGKHGIAKLSCIDNFIFLITSDLQILTCDVESLQIVNQIPGNVGEVTDVAYLEDGSLIMASNDSELRLFRTPGSLNCNSYSGHTEALLSISTIGNDWIVTGSRDHNARLWTRDSEGNFKCSSVLSGHTDSVGAVTIGLWKSSIICATASADSTIKLWEVQSNGTAHSRWTIKAHDKDINSLTVTPNMKYLISASQDKTAKIWKIEDGSCVGTLKGHKRGIWSVKCSPKEQLIATASGDQTVKIWSATTYECLKTFEGHSNSVLRVSFLRDGQELISSGSDGLVKIWDIKTNECTKTFDEHMDRIWTLAIGPDGKSLATGDASGVVKFWQDCTEEEIASAQSLQENQILMYLSSFFSSSFFYIYREQNLSNLLLRKDFKNAIILSIELEQPYRLFNLFNQYTKGCSLSESQDKLLQLLSVIPLEKIVRIVAYIKEWNVSFKRAPLAQSVLNAILRTVAHQDCPELRESFKALLPYSERHLSHVQDLTANSYLVDFVLAHMDGLSM